MTFPDRSALRPAAALAGVLALTCALALPLRAQVTQKPVIEPRPPARVIQPPKAPVGDLVILAVTASPTEPGVQLRIKNAGAAAVTVPAGTVLARGDAARTGGFSPSSTGTSGVRASPSPRGATVQE